MAIGQTLTGTATLYNPTAASITLLAADIAARPPGGTNAGGPFLDLYDGAGVTIAAGQSFVLTGGRQLTSADPLGGWYAYVTVEDAASTYHDSADDVDFTVVAASSSSSSGGTGASSSSSSSSSSGSTGAASSSSSSSSSSGSSSSGGGTAPSCLNISGGHLVDGAGTIVHLHGADRSGTEFACTYESGGSAAEGFPGFFDGPNDQTGVSAMLSWNINAVRVPLNEDCWLGINGFPYNDTAADYQAAIVDWVNLLNQNGLVVILDLHWAAPGTDATSTSVGQLPMADLDHAPDFWTSVATTFAGNSSVIFDLFNEPYITDWGCWTSGDPASADCAKDENGTAYAVAGMANLLQAVRNAGANNVAILGGLGYSSDFSSWVSSVNSIPSLAAPLNNISIANVAASWHSYDFNSGNSGCPSEYNGYTGTCYTGAVTAANADITDVINAGFAVIMGESGISADSAADAAPFSASQITDLESWYTGTNGLLPWLDSQGQSYLAWSWNTDTGPVLLSDYTGTPSLDYGTTYQAYLTQF